MFIFSNKTILMTPSYFYIGRILINDDNDHINHQINSKTRILNLKITLASIAKIRKHK